MFWVSGFESRGRVSDGKQQEHRSHLEGKTSGATFARRSNNNDPAKLDAMVRGKELLMFWKSMRLDCRQTVGS